LPLSGRAALAVSVLVVGATAFSGATAAFACSEFERDAGMTCTSGGSINGGQVDLEGSRSSAGARGTADARSEAGPRRPTAAEQRLARERAGGRPEFWVEYTPPPAAPGAPAITLDDIASFRPAVGSDHTEPDGWTVVGLHTNFYSDARTHTVEGTLLGAPASVRFTPRSWTWDYGDGSTRTSARPGASWSALGVPEFEQTATSHVYATAATATVRLTIGFGAEYRLAGGEWTPIAGTLAVPAPPVALTARAADTVLVGADCGRDPGGPGC
jgi:hypothetical protein